MRLFRQDHVYQHDWATVTTALWGKYPNALQPHVIRVDTLDRVVEPMEQRYRCLRLLSLQYSIPSWVQTLLHRPITTGYAIEEVNCDANTRVLTLKSRNITFSSFLQIEETCVYSPLPSDPNNATLYTQEAQYKIVGFGSWISSALENAVVQTAAHKAKAGLEAMQTRIEWLEKKSLASADTVKSTVEHNVHVVEQKLLETKEQLDKTFLQAKHHVHDFIFYHPKQSSHNSTVLPASSGASIPKEADLKPAALDIEQPIHVTTQMPSVPLVSAPYTLGSPPFRASDWIDALF